MIEELKDGRKPKIAEEVFIASSADIVGEVNIGKQSSIWYQTVIRGDVMPVHIGEQTNVQDKCVIHGTYKKAGTTLGRRVSIGHGVILHGCLVEDFCLVGMGSIIMDNVVVGHHSLVGAGSLLTEGKVYPPEHLILGSPAKAVRPLTSEEIEFLDGYADKYLMYKTWYKDQK